jgi:hypothetical protein
MEFQVRARLISVAAALLLAVDLVAAGPKFTSLWKAPEASTVRFTGKRVAALVITSDQHLQISAEEQLAAELKKRNVDATPTYRLVPKEELTTASVRGWYERAGIEGVISLRPISAETVRTYTPVIWSSSSYNTLWGYYDYGWAGVYSPSSMSIDTRLVVETVIHSVPLNKLLWAGVSTTTNPKEAPKFIASLIDAALKEMKKQGLVR